MDNLRPSPKGLPARAWLLLTSAAVGLLLWQEGTTAWREVLALLSGTLPLEEGGRGYLHALLPRALATLALVSGALVLGASLAMAVTCLGSLTGRWGLRVLSWVGRLLGALPVMLWALLATVVLVRHWNVPVETLFPYEPPAEKDTLALRLGRQLWALLLPVTVLALPAFGLFLTALAQRTAELLAHEHLLHYRARGIGEGEILHRHLMPHLSLDLVRQARSCLPLLVAFSIPVEEILGCQGLGATVAQTMESDALPRVLPAALYLVGWLLLPWLIVLGWLEQRSAVIAIEPGLPTGSPRSLVCAIAGGVLGVLLILVPLSMAALQEARAAWPRELWFAMESAVISAVLVVISVPIWQWWDRLKPTWYLGLVPAVASEGLVFLMLLVASPVWMSRPYAPLVTGGLFSLAGIAMLRYQAREIATRPMVEAAHVLGATSGGILRHHQLRFLAPALGRWTLRMVAVILLLMGLAHFHHLSHDTASTWGGQMRSASQNLFDHPSAIMAPAGLLAGWCLCFFLVSRAFRTDLPAREIPPARRSSYSSLS